MHEENIHDGEMYLEPAVEVNSAVSAEAVDAASVTICGCCFC